MTPDRIWGLIFVVTGVAMGFDASRIAAPFRSLGDPGPGLLPLSLGVAMAFLGLLLALRPAALQPEAGAESAADGADTHTMTIRVAPPGMLVRSVIAAATLAYVALFPRLGFTLATLPFLLITIALLGKFEVRSLVSAAVVGTVATLLVGWVLAGLVGLPLPGVLVGGR